jgi:hypothetical protein
VFVDITPTSDWQPLNTQSAIDLQSSTRKLRARKQTQPHAQMKADIAIVLNVGRQTHFKLHPNKAVLRPLRPYEVPTVGRGPTVRSADDATTFKNDVIAERGRYFRHRKSNRLVAVHANRTNRTPSQPPPRRVKSHYLSVRPSVILTGLSVVVRETGNI